MPDASLSQHTSPVVPAWFNSLNKSLCVACGHVSLHAYTQERNAAVKGKLAAKVSKQPMFCFESAIKLFYFSSFVYNDYNAVRLSEGQFWFDCSDCFRLVGGASTPGSPGVPPPLCGERGVA